MSVAPVPMVVPVVTFESANATPAATAVPPDAPVVIVVVVASVAVAVSVRLCAPRRSAPFATDAVVVSLTMLIATEAPTPVESLDPPSTFALPSPSLSRRGSRQP